MEPKIIAVANTKGGVGKTTVALQLAIGRARQGKSVWLIDSDRQQTALTALAIRDSQGIEPVIACAAYTDAAQMRAQIKHQKDKWDSIFIDVSGVDSSALRTALAICDVLVVPFQPRSFDVWGLSQIGALITEVQDFRDTFPVLAFLNSADPQNSRDNVEAEEALQDFPQMTFIDTPIRRRKSIANACGMGLGVDEIRPKDPKAIAEVRALLDQIFGKENE